MKILCRMIRLYICIQLAARALFVYLCSEHIYAKTVQSAAQTRTLSWRPNAVLWTSALSASTIIKLFFIQYGTATIVFGSIRITNIVACRISLRNFHSLMLAVHCFIWFIFVYFSFSFIHFPMAVSVDDAKIVIDISYNIIVVYSYWSYIICRCLYY